MKMKTALRTLVIILCYAATAAGPLRAGLSSGAGAPTYANAVIGEVFTASVAGVDLLSASTNTTIFTVPAGKNFVTIRAYMVPTTLTGAASGNWTTGQLTESSAASVLSNTASFTSVNQVIGRVVEMTVPTSGGEFYATAGTNVRYFNPATVIPGWTTATATIFVVGFYF